MILIYFLLWVVFNGNFTLEIALLGIVIALVLYAFTCRYMGFSFAKEKQVYKKLFLFVSYVILLVKEIVKANFGVIHLILSQEEEIEPMLVTFHSDLKTQTGKAFLANAVTLTPGTITVSLEGSEFTVHCLDESMAEGMNDSEFVKYIHRLEK